MMSVITLCTLLRIGSTFHFCYHCFYSIYCWCLPFVSVGCRLVYRIFSNCLYQGILRYSQKERRHVVFIESHKKTKNKNSERTVRVTSLLLAFDQTSPRLFTLPPKIISILFGLNTLDTLAYSKKCSLKLHYLRL